MPIRAYRPLKAGRCPHCKDGFEHWEKGDENTLESCPVCGATLSAEAATCIFTPTVVRKPGEVEAKNAGFTVYKKNNDGDYDKQ